MKNNFYTNFNNEFKILINFILVYKYNIQSNIFNINDIKYIKKFYIKILMNILFLSKNYSIKYLIIYQYFNFKKYNFKFYFINLNK